MTSAEQTPDKKQKCSSSNIDASRSGRETNHSKSLKLSNTCHGQEPNLELLPPTILSSLDTSASIGGTPHSGTYTKSNVNVTSSIAVFTQV